jgi:hypothetical protein
MKRRMFHSLWDILLWSAEIEVTDEGKYLYTRYAETSRASSHLLPRAALLTAEPVLALRAEADESPLVFSQTFQHQELRP